MIKYVSPGVATSAVKKVMKRAGVQGVQRVWTRPLSRGRLHTVVHFTDKATDADRSKAVAALKAAEHQAQVRSDGTIQAISMLEEA